MISRGVESSDLITCQVYINLFLIDFDVGLLVDILNLEVVFIHLPLGSFNSFIACYMLMGIVFKMY